MANKVTCIIPFINEGERPLSVLAAVSQIKEINQIICVDGSSNDTTSDLIKKLYPKVNLIKQQLNLGKSEAIKLGLGEVINTNILLLDADIVGLNTGIIEKSILYFLKHQSIDMILFKRSNTHLIEKILRGNVLVIGERLIKKVDLENIFNEFKPTGYQIEIATNHYMMIHNKKVLNVSHTIYKPPKFKKMGIIKGIYQDIKMEFEVLKLFGFRNWFKQYLLFGKNEIEIYNQIIGEV